MTMKLLFILFISVPIERQIPARDKFIHGKVTTKNSFSSIDELPRDTKI